MSKHQINKQGSVSAFLVLAAIPIIAAALAVGYSVLSKNSPREPGSLLGINVRMPGSPTPNRTRGDTTPPPPTGGGGNTSGLGKSGGTGPIIVQNYAGIQPFKDAPKCASHNDTEYHGVWNDELGCYYDHTHGWDPKTTVFAETFENWSQEISYPWETTNENEIKHNGYFYIYDESRGGCEQGNSVSNDNCVTHILLEVHSIGTTLAATTRYHSYRAAARVCDKSLNNCGIVELGGWADFGVLHCPYKKEHCPLASDPQPLAADNGVLPDIVTIVQPPYRTSVPIADYGRNAKSGLMTQFWSSLGPNPVIQSYYPVRYNNTFEMAWSFNDAWGGIDPSDVTKGQFVCEDGSCEWNHTSYQMWTLKIKDLPGGSFSTYLDKTGELATNCSQEGPDCIPFKATGNVPAGTAFFNRPVKHGDGNNAPIYETDVCFSSTGTITDCRVNGDNTAGWIKPNDMTMNMMNTLMMEDTEIAH